MPYVNEEARLRLEPLARIRPLTPGELNYCITKLVLNFMASQTHNYAAYNAAVGAMENAKNEFQWRCLRHYEDEAMKKHGDVFPGDVK
jgi:hypothetical protein